jgi:uncharacterized tellurite resistance protein B-like protein
MLKKFFKKKESPSPNNKNILIAALLVHAAKIDNKYTDSEKIMIKRALIELNSMSENEADETIKIAEQKEKDSNQIIEFTKEIKKSPLEFRIKIIELLWKIIYSDSVADEYETTLIRRVCGLLYISAKDSGEIKLKIEGLKK